MVRTERLPIDELRQQLRTLDCSHFDEANVRRFIEQARVARGGTDSERIDLQLEGLRLLRINGFSTWRISKNILFNDDSSPAQTLRALCLGLPRVRIR